MRTLGVAVISVCSMSAVVAKPLADQPQADQSQAQEASTAAASSTGTSLPAWLHPAEAVDQALPSWLQFGGEFRTRVGTQDVIRYTRTRDLYVLSRFRLNVTIKPVKWLTLVAETQDSRVFLNRHIPSALPYQNTWDIRQAYVELGSSAGWADLIVGRQVFAFGDERVLGPSDWINAGRTFDAMRLDLHHGGAKVSLFASSP